MSHDRVPQPMELRDPLDYEEARAAYKESGRQRRDARVELERRIADLAEKERLYRVARAQAYVTVDAPAAGERDAKVDEKASGARRDRDIAKGMVDAAKERLAEIDADRASLHRLVEWSMRLDPYAQEQRRQEARAA